MTNGQPGDQGEPGPMGLMGPEGIPGSVGRVGLPGFPGANLHGQKGMIQLFCDRTFANFNDINFSI